MSQDIIMKANEIVGKNTMHGAIPNTMPYCVLALIDLNGYPTAAAISPAKADGIKWITFCTGIGSIKANRIKKCNRASVCFCNENYNVTLTGIIEIVTDPKIKNEMWYDRLKNHFTGSDDPEYCVLRFKTESYNLFIDWKEVRGLIQV